MFKKVDPKASFPEIEKEILDKWEKNKTFQASIDIRKTAPEFVFYDWPPFATWLPHYGHILAGTIKDVIPRYKTMRGFRVERVFWWDCHWLPIENLIEKELNLPDKRSIENFGISYFNEACRWSVLKYANEWEKTVNRMWRWVDFKSSYKTMDLSYMQSVWWVFGKLWEKDLVYKGKKAMHICPRCVTPLSNFEVSQNYSLLTDLSATVKFFVEQNDYDENMFFLAWTTTPWTILGNTALAVWEDIEYSFMKKWNEIVVLASACIENYKEKLEDYSLLSIKKWVDLAKYLYSPVFSNYLDKKDEWAFRVVLADFVNTQTWTGIVHIAPAFGEDDLEVCRKENLPFISHVTMNWYFVEEIDYFPKEPVKDKKDNMKMDRWIVEHLTKDGKIFDSRPIRHEYPICWRCDTPLLNYSTDSWFINVERIKQQLIDNNQQINWIPENIKNWRFWNWLENARDWAFSRNRYWWTPIPIWKNDKTGNYKCVTDIGELEKLTWKKVVDLHLHLMDDFCFALPNETWIYKPIKEVFDCWFESGAMPYWSKNYPFNERIVFNNKYFIARHWEGIQNVQDICSCKLETNTKYSLTDKGRKTVKENCQKLWVKFDYIFCSPFLRTKQTAEIISSHCWGIIIEDIALKEYDTGIFDWCPNSEWWKWLEENTGWDNAPKTWESRKSIIERVWEFINRINDQYKDKTICIVSHGTPLEVLSKYVKWYTTKEQYMADHNKYLPTWWITQLHSTFKFPADFIAEWIDQTRGWFYTLHILGAALFWDKAFDNCIVNGIVLAEDWKKMSKRLKNYPEPDIIFDKYWADAMRFYLMNSPVVEWESFRFSEKGVNEVVKNIILPLWNSYSFFVLYANIDQIDLTKEPKNLSKLDKWILWELEETINAVTLAMDSYKLNYATKHFVDFLEHLTNWYIRRSRKRFWSKMWEKEADDKLAAYKTLYRVIWDMCKLLAPFCPFITEHIYSNLYSNNGSIHHQVWPESTNTYRDKNLIEKIHLTQQIVSLGLALRKKLDIKVRQPLSKMQVAISSNINLSEEFETIKEELNIKEIEILDSTTDIATLEISPNAKILGPRFGKKVQEIITEAKKWNFSKNEDWTYNICGETISVSEISIWYKWINWKEVASDMGIVVYLDPIITKELEQEWLARDIIREVAEMRKECWYEVIDQIELEISDQVIQDNFGDLINKETLSSFASIAKADKVTLLWELTIKIRRLD